MLHLTSNVEAGKFNLNLPTSLSEISNEYLKSITDDITIAEHYALIAISYKAKLIDLLMTANNKKPINTVATYSFIKANVTKDSFLSTIPVGTKLIVNDDQVNLYKPINIPTNVLSIKNILNHTVGDKVLYSKTMSIHDDIYCLEFSIVPMIDILGTTNQNNESNVDNEFIKPIE